MSVLTFTALILGLGCTFDEQLPEVDLKGTIRIPKDQFYYTLGKDEEAREVTDIRGMGPVYIGAFPNVETGLFSYPHPEMGPILGVGQDGNTYPYGGSTIGRFEWACYQPLICKVTTGRFSDFDDLMGFFRDVIQEPVVTEAGHEVGSSAEFRERCFEVLNRLGDYELSFIGEPHFEDDGDDLVAEFSLPHTYYREGMKLWGWVDMPSTSYNFGSCDPGVGETINYYNENYDAGTNVMDLLNYPGKYIDDGDLIVDVEDAPSVVLTEEQLNGTEPMPEFEINIGFRNDEE